MSITYYHNPKCSKSRAGLAILQEQNIDAELRLYLEDPLSIEELNKIVAKLGIKPIEIARKKEAAEVGITADMSDDEIIAILSQNPHVIERPILEIDEKATVGRPTENIIQLIDEAL
ncbi:MAG: ArsC/Spx/MgsR family protein [Alphaproteobacteria bacterium]